MRFSNSVFLLIFFYFPGLGNRSFWKWAIAFFLRENDQFGKLPIFRSFLLFCSFRKSDCASNREQAIAHLLFCNERMSKRLLICSFAMSQRATNCSIALFQCAEMSDEQLPNQLVRGLSICSFWKWVFAFFWVIAVFFFEWKNELFWKSLIFCSFLFICSFWKSERVIEQVIAHLKRANEQAIAHLLFCKERLSNGLLICSFAMSEWATKCSIALFKWAITCSITLCKRVDEQQITQLLFCNERMSNKLLSRSFTMIGNEQWANERLPNQLVRGLSICSFWKWAFVLFFEPSLFLKEQKSDWASDRSCEKSR